MKLPKGPLKVITFTTAETLEENERRSRAGGKIFHPTVHIAVEPAEEDAAPTFHSGFGVVLPKDAQVKSGITVFPHGWAGRRNVPRYWIETTEAVEVITSTKESK